MASRTRWRHAKERDKHGLDDWRVAFPTAESIRIRLGNETSLQRTMVLAERAVAVGGRKAGVREGKGGPGARTVD